MDEPKSGVCAERLRQLASQFRRAVGECSAGELPVGLQHFPRGACGDACLLLGEYLKDQGISGVEYVSGSMPVPPHRVQTHAWLEVGGFIVDITADQFGDGQPPVVVTTDTRWYERFQDRQRLPAYFSEYDDYTRAALGEAFRQIQRHLRPH